MSTGQAMILLLTGLPVLYHVCMRNDAELLKKVKEPARRKIQALRDWIYSKLEVRYCVVYYYHKLHLHTEALRPVYTNTQRNTTP